MDHDRDAIFKRRQRLIALALSGMSFAACDAGAEPCLEPPTLPSERTGQTEGQGQGDEGPILPPDPDPLPCLEPPRVEPDPSAAQPGEGEE